MSRFRVAFVCALIACTGVDKADTDEADTDVDTDMDTDTDSDADSDTGSDAASTDADTGSDVASSDTDTDAPTDVQGTDTDPPSSDSDVQDSGAPSDTEVPSDSEPVSDTGTDVGPSDATGSDEGSDTGASDTDLSDTDLSDTELPIDTGREILTVSELEPGDLIITEIMADPVDCGDNDAEYFEVYNASGAWVDLSGLQVADASATKTLVAGALVGPGHYFVARRQGSPWCYGSVDYDVEYPTHQLNNGGDAITLLAAGVEIDTVDFGNWDVPSGASLQLDHHSRDALLNDDETHWCVSEDLIPGATSDAGSPGVRNARCEVPTDTGPTPPEDTGPSTDTATDAGPVVLGVEDLGAGDLIITEIMSDPTDCGDNDAEYFEIYNASGATVDLTGLLVADAAATRTVVGGATVAAGEYVVARRQGSPWCYGAVVYDIEYPTHQLNNGGDTLTLSNSSGVIDAVDFMTWGALPGASWQLDRGLLDADANDDLASWCPSTATIPGAVSDKGSPGARNARCGVPTDTGSAQPDDTGVGPVDSGGVSDTDVGPVVLGVDDLGFGDLVITEIMSDPTDCGDNDAEYFEIYNASGAMVDLTGLKVADAAATRTIVGGVTVAAGEYIVARRQGSPWCYDAVGYDIEYPTHQLNNGGDTLTLSNSTLVIDAVDFMTWGALSGTSRQLDRGLIDADANDDPASWCPSTDTINGAVSDKGSPGARNARCDAPTDTAQEPVDTGLPVDTGAPEDTSAPMDTEPPVDTSAPVDTEPPVDTSVPVDTEPPVDTAPPVLTVEDLGAGDLVITEIMPDPTDCTDNEAEYFELYNASGSMVDLTGLKVADAAATRTIAAGVTVAPGEYVVARRQGTTWCYAPVEYDIEYPTHQLNNGGDTLTLSNSTVVIDAVDFMTWGPLSGVSWQLDRHLVDAIANDDPAAWCPSTTFIPGSDGDLGSPGERNARCDGADTAVVVLSDTGRTDAPFGDTGTTDVLTEAPTDLAPTDTAQADTGDSGGASDSGGMPAPAATLMIVEVGDHPTQGTIKYVQLYNPGAAPIEMSGWFLHRYSNGSSTPGVVTLPAGQLAGGSSWVIGPTGSGGTAFTNTFGIPASQSSGNVDGNGNDAYALFEGTVLRDVYGAIGVNGTGTAWEYTDRIVKRASWVTAPNDVWTASEWILDGGAADAAPFDRN